MFSPDCHNCVCSVCTGQFCPHKSACYGYYRFRCARCVRDGLGRLLECDFFRSKFVRPRHFRIKCRRHRKGWLEKRLDLIMDCLGITIDGKDSS